MNRTNLTRLTIIGVLCITSCGPKDHKDSSDASNHDELKVGQTRPDAVKDPAPAQPVVEEPKTPPGEETMLKAGKEAAERIEREAVARKKALEEKAAAARAARSKLIGTRLDSIELPNKRSYAKVEIRNITDVNLSISHESGMATIRMSDLSPQDQKRFHFDKDIAAEIEKARSAQASEIVSSPPATQPDAATSGKQAEAAARKVALLREEIAKEESKLAEMEAGLVRLKTEHQNVINEFNDETSNARRIKHTRYDGIGGNERYGGISTSKADRQMKIDAAAARVSSGEALIREVEARIRSLKSRL
jgi:hypothetical protein